MFSGGGRSRQANLKGKDISLSVDVDFMDAINGTTKTV